MYWTLCLNKCWVRCSLQAHALSLGLKADSESCCRECIKQTLHRESQWFLILILFWLKKKSLKSSKCRWYYNTQRTERYHISVSTQRRASLWLDGSSSCTAESLSCCWRGEVDVCLKSEAFPGLCVGWASPAPPLTASHPSYSPVLKIIHSTNPPPYSERVPSISKSIHIPLF